VNAFLLSFFPSLPYQPPEPVPTKLTRLFSSRCLFFVGGSHRPSFGSSSLKPSTVFHLNENEAGSSSTAVRRPSHSSSSLPAAPTPEQQNYLPQLAENQDQLDPVVERTSFTIEEPSSADEANSGLGGDLRDTGSLYSTRGALILFTVGMSQMLDNGTYRQLLGCPRKGGRVAISRKLESISSFANRRPSSILNDSISSLNILHKLQSR